MTARELPVLEATWFIPGDRLPIDVVTLLDLIATEFPKAAPVRYGPGDPPRHSTVKEGLDRFREIWRQGIDGEVGSLAWQGSPPVLYASVQFPIDRNLPRAVASMRWYLDGSYVEQSSDSIVTTFTNVSSTLKAPYACAYYLDRWSLENGVLAINVNASEESHLPGGTRWLGVPPGLPWLSWFGSEYTRLLRPLLAETARGVGEGLIVRRADQPTRQSDPGLPLNLPEEVLARKRDDRFWAMPPSEPAEVIPEFETLSAFDRRAD